VYIYIYICCPQTTPLRRSAEKVCLGQSETCPHTVCVELKLLHKRNRALSDSHSHELLCIFQASDDRQLQEYPHAYCTEGSFCYHMWPRFGAQQYRLRSELYKSTGENYQVPRLRVSCRTDYKRKTVSGMKLWYVAVQSVASEWFQIFTFIFGMEKHWDGFRIFN